MSYTYRALTAALAAEGIEDAATEARILLEALCEASYAGLLTEPDREYAVPALEAALSRRLSREPLQYILGEWDFCGCRFRVNEHCLIPRPDTEVLVEAAIRRLPAGARVADLCTGSGCVAVAVLHHRRDVRAEALELYPETLALARENAERAGVGARFTPVLADLLSDGVEQLFLASGGEKPMYDAILSNPPYIPTKVLPSLSPEVHCEPVAALDGGADGLLFYRAILKNYASLVRPGGLILLEIGFDQAKDLRALAAEHIPGAAVSVLQDLGGRDRVVAITLPGDTATAD